MLVCSADTAPVLLDFFVAVPGLGPHGRPLDPSELHAFTVPFGDADQVFHIGPASVAVPGMLQGLCAAWERFGHLPLQELVAPAVECARQGVVLSPQSAFLYRILGEMLVFSPDAAAAYAPHGDLLGEGDAFRNLDLASTLEEVGRTGVAAMRPGGWLAEMVVAGLADTGGLVTAADIAEYRVIERRPLEMAFRGRTVFTNPAPSSGGVLIAAALAQMQGRPPAVGAVAFYRAVAAAGEYANSLRTKDFARRLQDADADETDWTQFVEPTAGTPVTRGPNGTTHVSVVDAGGMIASLSSSNGTGSGVTIPGTGFLLNNMMGEQDLNPGGFGSMPAGIRMTSMMAPTVVMEGARPRLGLGSAGSNRLRSAILQTLVSIVDDRMPIADAVARPRVHPEGGGIDVEGGVPEEVRAALETDGRVLRCWGDRNLFFGGVSAVGWRGDELQGAGDPRRGGAAFGVSGSGEVIDLSTL
jgi:gamma-glutamyltranspeptidase/glutathione hydrolase